MISGKNLQKSLRFLTIVTVLFSASFAQNWLNLDTVKAKKFDTGKMWTFEHAPVEYFKNQYGFNASKEWLEKVRLSALQFANWCSASFVSEDGLIATNHHCIDFISESIQKEGENIPKNGFYATTLADERKVPNLYVDQMIMTEDVTDEINGAINAAKTDKEKIEIKNKTIKEVEERYTKETGLLCKVKELYYGGRYSLYGYKRYSDIRAVYFNERVVGLYGGDPDNFTYPRYNADFALLRAYDETGKPVKTKNFYKWSTEAPVDGELVFVVGRPGQTQRLKTVAQLEFFRDFVYNNQSLVTNGLFKVYDQMIAEKPEKADEYRGQQFFIGNSAKVFKEVLKGLRDPYFMARKKAFEKEFKATIMAKPELQTKYGHLWQSIENIYSEVRKYSAESVAFGAQNNNNFRYLGVAGKLITLAEELKKAEADRKPEYKGETLSKTIDGIFPKDLDQSFEEKTLALFIEVIKLNLGKDNEYVKLISGNKEGKDAIAYLLSKMEIKTAADVKKLAEKGSEAILNSNDPLLRFVAQTRPKLVELQKKIKEITSTESAIENQLGQALYAVYGASIPPDATSTLRISDGLVQGYEYNGTVAPTITTFYGLYDRFYSHKQKYPWDLPERWAKPGKDFNLETPYNFVSTNDIIGGNSGSAVINKNAEVVGLAFDGNIESMPGNFIYTTEANRTVNVSSAGIVEILSDLLGYKRISEELKAGKIPENFK